MGKLALPVVLLLVAVILVVWSLRDLERGRTSVRINYARWEDDSRLGVWLGPAARIVAAVALGAYAVHLLVSR